MQGDLADYRKGYEALRAVTIPNDVPPALVFNPLPGQYLHASDDKRARAIQWSRAHSVKRPANLEDCAFWSVRDLAELIRTKQVTSTELTQMYIARLKRYAPKLECVVTFTEDRALASAKKADEEIAKGHYRGILHGIPYGAKDLLAVQGYKTTWGSAPYQDQTIDQTATVVKRLDDAGAVLIAKLTLGELAWGDVWFGGMTRNPWNLEEGSSGSSAGSASATSCGLRRVCNRHRDMGLDRVPVDALRCDRASSHVRSRESRGRDGALVVDGQDWSHLPHRGGLRHRARRDQGPRRDRSRRRGRAVHVLDQDQAFRPQDRLREKRSSMRIIRTRPTTRPRWRSCARSAPR
jgi:hypothetical protein